MDLSFPIFIILSFYFFVNPNFNYLQTLFIIFHIIFKHIHIFFLFATIHIILTTIANNSATTTDNHIPFIPQTAGNIKIIATWNNNVLKNDISAEIKPLFKAVKNDDVNILNQLII